MSKRSADQKNWSEQRQKIIGLGERSVRKTYYPELQEKLDELERFRSLLDQSNDCIFLFKLPSLAFVDVNESACRLLGCSHREFLASTMEKLLPEEAAVRVRDLVNRRHCNGQDRDTITTELHNCSNGILPVEMTVRLVAFNNDMYGVAVARDITDRKRAEKALLENSKILRDMELAHQIQNSLLPSAAPELPGALFAGCCVPAAHVGGDYYDYYRRGDGVIDLVIADVSGHNIGAALMMSEVRSVLRAQIHAFDNTAEILSCLNDDLYDDLNKAGLFITMFYAKFDARSRTLTYSNAGHIPPVLFQAEMCKELDAEGLILGVKTDVVFEQKRLQLQENDILLLFTDGITESRNSSGKIFGHSKLRSIVNSSRSEPPNEIIDSVLHGLSKFTETTAFEDDVTMIVMKVT